MEMYKNHKKYIATVSLGESRILQDAGSDVSLQIPNESQGVFMTHVQTDPSRFLNEINEGENRLISPTVEVHHKNIHGEQDAKIHTVKIPHCINKSDLWDYIQVGKFNVSNNKAQIQMIPLQDKNKKQDEYYTIDKDSIRVYTKRFSEFICTICKKSCQASIMAFMFGKIEDVLGSKITTVQLKVFMGSDLYRIKEFKDVSSSNICIYFLFFCNFTMSHRTANLCFSWIFISFYLPLNIRSFTTYITSRSEIVQDQKYIKIINFALKVLNMESWKDCQYNIWCNYQSYFKGVHYFYHIIDD